MVFIIHFPNFVPTYYPINALVLVQFRIQYHHISISIDNEHMHVIVDIMDEFDRKYFPIVVQMLSLRMRLTMPQHHLYSLCNLVNKYFLITMKTVYFAKVTNFYYSK